MHSHSLGYACIRYIFCALNGLIWILGCGVIGVAIWLRITYQGYLSLLPAHEVLSLDCVVMIGGIILFIVAFLGCCGAWCKNRCALLSYFILVAVLCVVELLTGMLGFFYRDTVTSTLQDELLLGITKNYNTSQEGITLAWDHIHHQLSCCGVRNYFDWFNITAWPNKNYVPHSCCISSFQYMEDCGRLEEISMWFPSGCYGQVEKWFEERLHIVGITGFVVAFIQLCGLASSMVLFCAARRRAGFKTYKAEKSPALL